MAKLTIRQASERTGVSTSLLYQMCAERRLPHFRLGRDGRRGKLLVEEGDLEAFLAAARVEARAGDDTAVAPPLRHITRK